MRTYVFGDIHGAGLELSTLISNLNLNEDDRLVFVGDLFDRGLHGHVVWDIVNRKSKLTSFLKNPILSVAGNHEVKFVNYLKENRKKEMMPIHYLWFLDRIYKHGVKKEEFLNYCESLPYLLNINDNIIVHGGIKLTNPYEPDFSSNVYGVKEDGVYWWDKYQGDKTIIYGHLGERDHSVRVRHNSYGIDTGIVFGGYVTAYCLEDKKIYSHRSGIDWKREFKKVVKDFQ